MIHIAKTFAQGVDGIFVVGDNRFHELASLGTFNLVVGRGTVEHVALEVIPFLFGKALDVAFFIKIVGKGLFHEFVSGFIHFGKSLHELFARGDGLDFRFGLSEKFVGSLLDGLNR